VTAPGTDNSIFQPSKSFSDSANRSLCRAWSG
jgi:hypothetical protein